MIKVCHIVSGDLWAGAEVSAYNLLAGLRQHIDLNCSAIVLNHGRLADSIQALDIPVSVFDETKMSFIEICKGIRRVLSADAPHILHSHRYKENLLAYLATRTKKDMRLVASQHGLPESAAGTLKERLKTIINFRMLSAHFHIVAVSSDIRRNLMERYNLSGKNISVIHNGIPVPALHCLRPEKKLFTIGSAGRAVPIKDYPFMVEVAREVVKKTDGIRFVLAGDGPELKKINVLVQKYRLEKNFLLTGFIHDMESFYQGLDLYLNTSIHEGISMSVLQAMAGGIPVVAPKTGGFEEIVDNGRDGFLIETRNSRHFAEKCMTIYGNSLLRAQMGKAAHEKIADNFSVERMVQQYHEAYLNI